MAENSKYFSGLITPGETISLATHLIPLSDSKPLEVKIMCLEQKASRGGLEFSLRLNSDLTICSSIYEQDLLQPIFRFNSRPASLETAEIEQRAILSGVRAAAHVIDPYFRLPRHKK